MWKQLSVVLGIVVALLLVILFAPLKQVPYQVTVQKPIQETYNEPQQKILFDGTPHALGAGQYVALPAYLDVEGKLRNQVRGEVKEGTGLTIWFFVFDQKNYNAWRSGQNHQPYATASDVRSYGFSFVPDHTDNYFFVLSNTPAFLASKAPQLTATWSWEVTKTRTVMTSATETRYRRVPIWK